MAWKTLPPVRWPVPAVLAAGFIPLLDIPVPAFVAHGANLPLAEATPAAVMALDDDELVVLAVFFFDDCCCFSVAAHAARLAFNRESKYSSSSNQPRLAFF